MSDEAPPQYAQMRQAITHQAVLSLLDRNYTPSAFRLWLMADALIVMHRPKYVTERWLCNGCGPYNDSPTTWPCDTVLAIAGTIDAIERVVVLPMMEP